MLLEALSIGLLASIVGIGAGLGSAAGINGALQGARASDLPDERLVARAAARSSCALLVGVGVTLLAALGPALPRHEHPADRGAPRGGPRRLVAACAFRTFVRRR